MSFLQSEVALPVSRSVGNATHPVQGGTMGRFLDQHPAVDLGVDTWRYPRMVRDTISSGLAYLRPFHRWIISKYETTKTYAHY